MKIIIEELHILYASPNIIIVIKDAMGEACSTQRSYDICMYFSTNCNGVE
jgi:hypothetical protein